MNEQSWSDSRRAFGQAAAWFAGMTGACGGRGDQPGLGEWTVRDLVGHTSRALLTVESYLDQPAATIDVDSAVEYFLTALPSRGDATAVAQRGREAGAALGADMAASVSELAKRVVARIGGEGPGTVVATPVGGMYLGDYLPTRPLS